MQRRFLNNGIVDVGFELQTQIDECLYISIKKLCKILVWHMRKTNHQLNRGKLCPVLRCMQPIITFFKTNFQGGLYDFIDR